MSVLGNAPREACEGGDESRRKRDLIDGGGAERSGLRYGFKPGCVFGGNIRGELPSKCETGSFDLEIDGANLVRVPQARDQEIVFELLPADLLRVVSGGGKQKGRERPKS